jgi:hypothetical protein
LNSIFITIAALVLIAAVFAAALVLIGQELQYVRLLADYLGYASAEAASAPESRPPRAGLVTEGIRDEVNLVLASKDETEATKRVRSWQMQVQRLESALAFWVDLLRQLGLLGTVLGLGLSLLVDSGNVVGLMRPLGLAVWTTVEGLAFSLVLTGLFGMKVSVWADTCEKNIEAWDTRRRAARERVAP